MTEDLPLAATTVKGRTRAAMTEELLAAADAGRVRIAIGRASDFFGAGVTETTLGERVFANALAGKRADFIGNPDLLHTYSYVPDVAAGLATLGTDERAVGGGWHLPGPETVTTRAVLDLVAREVGHPVAIRSAAQAGGARAWRVQPDDARARRDGLRVRGTVRAGHDQVPVHVRDHRHAARRRDRRDRRLVPQPRRHAKPATGRTHLMASTDSPLAAGADALDGVRGEDAAGGFRALVNPATGEWIRFTAVPEHGDEDIVRFNWRSEPGGAIPEHVHPHQEERFIISAGEAHFTLNGDSHVLVGPGESIVVPVGVRHAEANPGSVAIEGVVELRPALHTREMHEAFAGLAADGKTTSRGAPRNPLQLGATLWRFRHESRVTSPPIWVQNLMLPPLSALAKVFGVRPHYPRWDSRIPGAD